MSDSLGKFRGTVDELQTSWQTAREHWSDVNAERFLENHLQPLEVELAKAYQAIQRMADVMAQAQRECDPDSLR